MNYEPADPRRRFAVIGGGITGLAAAHRLVELEPAAEVTLFEASHRLGGTLWTDNDDGFLIEQGADSFITKDPWALDLCHRLGLTDELISTNLVHRGAKVVKKGRLHHLPAGFQLMATPHLLPILTSPLLSLPGRLRMAKERFIRPPDNYQEESLAEFASRRLGREAFEWLVEPLISGIFTADARRLSVAAAVPQFVEMEHRWGSLTRGMQQQRNTERAHTSTTTGARYELFTSLRNGMGSLVEALTTRLQGQSIETGCRIRNISTTSDGRWKLISAKDSKPQYFHGVILAIAAPTAADLVRDELPALASPLANIEYANSAMVSLSYRTGQVARPINCFGIVVPAVEQRSILAASFSSIKFAGRAPQGHLLVRVFLGGAMNPGLVQLPDKNLSDLAINELEELLGIEGKPGFCQVTRWERAMPQYNIGHLEKVDNIERQLDRITGLELAGNSYRGVGIPQCIHSGERAAQLLLQYSDA